jgi:hypothetical protein
VDTGCNRAVVDVVEVRVRVVLQGADWFNPRPPLKAALVWRVYKSVHPASYYGHGLYSVLYCDTPSV